MKGDFSRDTFDRTHRFARVLMQQGRVLLDADWNEQTSILLHTLRTLAADLIGPHGGPGDGFEILCKDENGDDLVCDFVIRWGHYYVGGILCENDRPEDPCPNSGPATTRKGMRYTDQPNYRLKKQDQQQLQKDKSYLVYLDVWERHLNHLQVDPISTPIREPALGGPDTATRAQVVWQVKVAEVTDPASNDQGCAALFKSLVSTPLVDSLSRCLRARARVDEPSDEPCIIPPEARYRGAENQLYRVEIHDPGSVDGSNGPTFKWSRDNGSVVFGIRSLKDSTAELDSLGPDERCSLKEGDWVEIVDDRSVLRFEPRPLAKVEAVDRVAFTVTLAAKGDLPDFVEGSTTHPLLRRWDQGSDVLPVEEDEWLDLEDGVQVFFESGGTYRAGDYWLIPARTATGDVLWPEEDSEGKLQPKALPPHGIEHHYAPLARIDVGDQGKVTCEDCRCSLSPLRLADRSSATGITAEPLIEKRPVERPTMGRPVDEIDGVGATFAGRLKSANITDAAAVGRLKPAELAKILTPPGGRAVLETLAASIIENARRLS